MSRTTLITGVNGFVGPYVARALTAAGDRVVGVARDAEPVGHLDLDDYVAVDLSEPITSLPDYDRLIHLAGISAVGPSFDHPRRYYETNGALALNVLEWHQRTGRQGRLLVVSTGAVYAGSGAGAIDEGGVVRSTSPYAVSKLLVENLADYFRCRGLDVVVARPFNHIGPGQTRGFLVPDLIAGLLEGERTGRAAQFGDLTSSRDYTDVRDVADAYIALLGARSLEHAVFNVCSGVPVEGTQLLGHLCGLLQIETPELSIDQSKLRPADQRAIRGSNRRILEATGWQPRISLSTSLTDILALASSSAYGTGR